MNIRLIIFDFDGTLGDTRRNIVTTMQMTIAELGLPSRSNAECISTIGLPLYGCFEALYPDIDKGIIQQCTDTYRRIFQENLQTIKPQTFPKVVETLSALKEKGYNIRSASVRFVVAWKPKDAPKEESESAVLLIDLVLYKSFE